MTRHFAAYVFSEVVEVDPDQVARYLSSLEPRLGDTNEKTRNFTAYVFYKVSEADPGRVARYQDALRPLQNDRNGNTQRFVESTLRNVDGERKSESTFSSDESPTPADAHKNTGTTDTKVFHPGEDDSR
jgi:hypothetical protein